MLNCVCNTFNNNNIQQVCKKVARSDGKKTDHQYIYIFQVHYDLVFFYYYFTACTENHLINVTAAGWRCNLNVALIVHIAHAYELLVRDNYGTGAMFFFILNDRLRWCRCGRAIGDQIDRQPFYIRCEMKWLFIFSLWFNFISSPN